MTPERKPPPKKLNNVADTASIGREASAAGKVPDECRPLPRRSIVQDQPESIQHDAGLGSAVVDGDAGGAACGVERIEVILNGSSRAHRGVEARRVFAPPQERF